jgi:hypothetical protein
MLAALAPRYCRHVSGTFYRLQHHVTHVYNPAVPDNCYSKGKRGEKRGFEDVRELTLIGAVPTVIGEALC